MSRAKVITKHTLFPYADETGARCGGIVVGKLVMRVIAAISQPDGIRIGPGIQISETTPATTVKRPGPWRDPEQPVSQLLMKHRALAAAT
jgi:hypothetical protein